MLRDLTTNEAADVLVQLAPLMDNIANDEELINTIGKAIKKDGLTKTGVMMEALHRVFTSVPVLLGSHRADLFGIIAAVKHKTAEEVAGQSIVVTKNEIKEILEDDDLIDFFDMFGRRGKSG